MRADLDRTLFDPAAPGGMLLYAAIFIAVATVLSKLGGYGLQRASRHPRGFIDKTSSTFIAGFLRVCLFLLAALLYAYFVPPLRQIGTALLASAGLISLVLGLAAQNTLGQMIAGLAILFYRPFEIDDVVTVLTGSGKEKTGVVATFTLGYTRLRARDGRSIVVPNSVMLSSILLRVDAQQTSVDRQTAADRSAQHGREEGRSQASMKDESVGFASQE